MDQKSKKLIAARKAKELSHRELEELMGKYKPTMGRSGGSLKHNGRSIIR
ncbi:hypothetical protein J7E55_12100 [Bacillus sp. ISL-53]|nr:hypothetical protein [Bacillus sp. ISL-53]